MPTMTARASCILTLYRNGLFVVREFIAPNGHRGTQMLVTPKGKQVFLAERAEIIG